MKPLPNLLWLKSFEAASRNGSFTAAGRELGLTQAAISTHISALETQLGHTLLARSTRKVELTESGRAYLGPVRKALQELAASTEALFGGPASGTVTIRAPISASVHIIAPALPQFQIDHPDLDIRLLSAIWANTVLDKSVDIEIRLGRGDWPGCHSEPLGPDHVVPVCHPDVARTIRSPGDVLNLPLIHILGFDDHWPQYCEKHGLDITAINSGMTVDTSLAAVEWVVAGGGCALLLERVARRLQDMGRLTIPLSSRLPLGQTHYLIHQDKTPTPNAAAQTTENWLRTLFA